MRNTELAKSFLTLFFLLVAMPFILSHLKHRHLKKTTQTPQIATQTRKERNLRRREGWIQACSLADDPRARQAYAGCLQRRALSGNAHVSTRYQNHPVRVMVWHFTARIIFFSCFIFCPPISISNQHSGGTFRCTKLLGTHHNALALLTRLVLTALFCEVCSAS